ncbi:MAG: NmrA family NAD(P)-binding protein, partial [Moorea sp. SIO3I7]|nr:NmrA family NAD(P)-binding protein [Moorena sp. SIO3I7]
VQGDLCVPETLPKALEGITAVIDAATSRPTDSLTIRQVDWEGKVALIQASVAAGIERYVFFSILGSENFPHVPLMEIKHCTELFLAESGLPHTILKPSGFMQGLIGQYAIPILDGQAVWITGETSPIAYMNTQDIAKFGIRALEVPETVNQTFPVVGTRAFSTYEIINLCERLSGKDAKIARLPINFLRGMRRFVRFFQWGWNVADRLAFTEVLVSGKPLDAPMEKVYEVFGLDPKETTTLEEYLQEYFNRIMNKLKEIDYEKAKKKSKKRTPFKSKS